MGFIAENWLILVLGGGMVATHLFGHGHGGKHGAGGCCGPKRADTGNPKNEMKDNSPPTA